MIIGDWSNSTAAQQANLLQRPAAENPRLGEQVAAIIAGVRAEGDTAVRRYNQEFDGVALPGLRVPETELTQAASLCAPELLQAMDNAAQRIETFHRAGMPQNLSLETTQGLRCEARYLPISPVGLYIPGGSAPLISTVLMLGIPARLAGCEQVSLATPASDNGRVPAAILAAAELCGIREVFAMGGAQAIAALAYGTESVPRCAKLFGPGNAWVTEAKRQAAMDPEGAAQDMPAGPSEVLVIADAGADAEAVCWDLLSQAEHGPDSQALLLTDDAALLQTVARRLPEMAAALPRAAILEQSLRAARLIQVPDLPTAVQISNRYAPEHLILNCTHAEQLADVVRTAGSVFIGPWTPESLGDYSAGTNHVLPTHGYARAYSGLSVTDFMRRMTLQQATRQGLTTAGADAEVLAAAEGLEAHRMAVRYRLQASQS